MADVFIPDQEREAERPEEAAAPSDAPVTITNEKQVIYTPPPPEVWPEDWPPRGQRPVRNDEGVTFVKAGQPVTNDSVATIHYNRPGVRATPGHVGNVDVTFSRSGPPVNVSADAVVHRRADGAPHQKVQPQNPDVSILPLAGLAVANSDTTLTPAGDHQKSHVVPANQDHVSFVGAVASGAERVG